MNRRKDYTTIWITKDAADRLRKKRKHPRETYEDTLRRMGII